MTTAYPLHWPPEWPRIPARKASQFKTSMAGALKNVQDSLRRFAVDSKQVVENVVISSNVSLGSQRPPDPGVAVYFSWDGISTCIAVDRYTNVEENLQAIHHCIEAERTKLRHGGLNLVRAAFRGYAALPPPSTHKTNWRTTLVLGEKGITLDFAEKRYKALAQLHHPDKPGGSAETMAALNAAIEAARAELSK